MQTKKTTIATTTTEFLLPRILDFKTIPKDIENILKACIARTLKCNT